jgi:DnaJ family protein C protein 2
LKIQNAYETLTDTDKKKKYDSTLPFEESIPEEPVNEKDFFATFKPVFIRNAFWSNKKPVPDIGDMNSDPKKVDRFYAFWDTFDSWRDFSVFDEYNLDEAENRFERRYMEKENKKIKGDHLKKERQRIMKLVNNAREYDPRLIKIRKEAEEARLKIKLEKQEKKDKLKKDKEDFKKKEEDAKLAKIREKEESDKKAQDDKKKRDADIRKAIKDLKTVFAEKVDHPDYDRFWLESFMEKLKHEDKIDLTNALTKAPLEHVCDELLVFIRKFDKTLERRSKELYQKDKELEKQRKEEEKKRKEADWSVEELSLLAKGLTKFPSGTKNRWGCVASFLGTKTAEEVLQKSKELSQTINNKATTERLNKEAFAQVQKAGMKDVGAEADTRAVYDQTRFTSIPVKEEKKTAEKPAEKKPNGVAAAAAPLEDDGWSQEEQKKLELALREFPATLEAQERWAKIAEKVGKTKKQCIDRFKQLRDAIKKTQPKK